MPEFQYTAREASGQQVSGSITANTQQEALSALSSRRLFPLQVEMAAASVKQQSYAGKRVGARQLAILYSQLADLLKSGVPLLRALELLNRQATKPALRHVLEEIRTDVADGTRLYESFRKHPRVFNELVVSMVRAGEEGGFLEEVLKRVAAFTDHQEDLKGRVIGAMIYPIILSVFGSAVVIFLLVKFVPSFEPIFAQMRERGDLPWATTSLLAMSRFAQNYWFVLLGLGAAAIYGASRYMQTTEGRLVVDTWRLKTIGLGRIVRNLATARFCRVLGTLLRNGVPILQSLRIAKDATGNLVLSNAISNAADNISAGKSLAKPLEASRQFSEEIVAMIAVGEESNNLEEVLIDISENLERRTNRELDLAVRLLEPLMLMVMASVVLFVIVALLLPILLSSTSV
ncbi:MAG: type II secretion system F family protein [Planctomycetaceae bacterium]|nr:type II secretion system F family protein [Planctomycetaceae bacterium]MCB0047341.1 type II secretion system F family protein [Caldilineaceae bacterium]